MYIPNEIKDLIHKYVLAIEHPVVKGLKDVRQKYWANHIKRYRRSGCINHTHFMKTISFYYGLDTLTYGRGYQVNLPKSKVTGPYCYQCGSLVEVKCMYSVYDIIYIPKHKLCRCDYRKIVTVSNNVHSE